ncbi:hypothetical protein MLD38_031552 [Melastoma candidum]|uniref:Uncharacterized protein n=1 Tax=Melastoma candidum TaxID=119954 RepID=A0ACB9MPM2_9MYRT|nr:hypothetical protein MLD38_031552 [Melastoma candidum]
MGVDLRQVVAGILTITMFVMLGNMIKRDHFDSVHEKLPGVSDDAAFEDKGEVSEKEIFSLSRKSVDPWTEDNKVLKQCWTVPSSDLEEDSKGFVTFSLTNGPEYHVSQIAAAVVVSRFLGATLVLPDIRGSKPGDKWSFGDIYNIEKFVTSLDGIVRVSKEPPSSVSPRNVAVVKVPNRVTEEYIVEHIVPVFKSKGNIRLATYFPSVNMRKPSTKSDLDSVSCLGMFGTLELQPEFREVVDAMVDRLRTLSRKADGQFLAVDLRVEMLEKQNCKGSKSCFDAQEVADFLKKVGFKRDTILYLTQSRWDTSLNDLKKVFPKTYTKETVMPMDKRSKFLESQDSEFEKVIDYYVCSESDVFVPAISGLFYANVAGNRIASGRTQILVPSYIDSSSASATEFISPFVKKKNHMAYSCFC